MRRLHADVKVELQVKPSQATQRIEEAASMDPRELLEVYAEQLQKSPAAIAVVQATLEVCPIAGPRMQSSICRTSPILS